MKVFEKAKALNVKSQELAEFLGLKSVNVILTEEQEALANKFIPVITNTSKGFRDDNLLTTVAFINKLDKSNTDLEQEHEVILAKIYATKDEVDVESIIARKTFPNQRQAAMAASENNGRIAARLKPHFD